MLTIGQRDALVRIATSLKRNPKEHMSESFRESFASYTDEQIAGTVDALRRIWATEDGRLAWVAIAASHRCMASVVGAYVRGELNRDNHE